MSWILTGVKAVMSVFTSALDALFKWVGVAGAYLLGGARQRAKDDRKALEIKDEQAEIAARPERHRSTLLERMRKRKRD